MRRLRLSLVLPLLLLLLLSLRFFQSISFSPYPSPYSTSPPVCSSETDFLVLVESLPPNSNLRKMIRSTWGNTTTLGSQFRLVFLISSDREEDLKRLYQDEKDEEEADIVFANPDSFLTLAGLAWSVSACPQVL